MVVAAAQSRLRLSPLAGSAGLDPLTAFARAGEIPAERSSALADAADAAVYLLQHADGFVPFLASDKAWHGAGASAVQDLAFTLSAAASYWRTLLMAGVSASQAQNAVGFALSATSDIFLTIAKFRAARLLWAHALEAAGQDPAPFAFTFAEMSPRILTAYDPHVNLLRGTAAAFAAAIGGADAIALPAFDALRGEITPASHRLARNTGLVLRHEAHLGSVADAAAGSAYVESLTEELASRAWSLLQDVEARGGLLKALESGFIQNDIEKVAKERGGDIARRRQKITGVSAFPDEDDRLGSSRPAAARMESPIAPLQPLPPAGSGERFAALVAAAKDGASLTQLRMASRRVSDILTTRLPAAARDAEPFEALRHRADIALNRIGSRPPIFLANLGKPSDYRARAAWVQSFFAVGGIETVAPEQGFDSVDALAAAFEKSPAPVACLCSSNAGYSAMPGVARALKKAGAVFVYLAGPASLLAKLAAEDASVIDRLLYEGCDALALLEEAHRILRVEDLSEAAQRDAEEQGFDEDLKAAESTF